MIAQGWPLWAVRAATGQVYAVVGWIRLTPSTGEPEYRPMVVELGVETDGPPAVVSGGGLRFEAGQVDAGLIAEAARNAEH